MSFADSQLSQNRPASVRNIDLPRRERYHPSPADWRDEALYFLMPDRFSDGQEQSRPLLNRRNLTCARPATPGGETWRWDRWTQSGAERWQGGTLRGLRSKLGYLKNLGVTAIWIGPVFKQRGHLDTYHGYGIQDFLNVDPHFGDRRDLVELVADAHASGMRVILDIIFNHSGSNWLYPPETPGGPFMPRYTMGRYPFGYFNGFDPGHAVMGSHRSLGRRHVSILDDHDHVFGDKMRFSSEAASDHQVVAGVILQLFTLGIPCIYYGTEQALAGPEASERMWLPDWGRSDRYLREAMFGPAHPRKGGRDGLVSPPDGLDTSLPGFGPFGTAGHHCFDETNPVFLRIAAACEARKKYPVLRCGRQYLRPIADVGGENFGEAGAGHLAPWSRILDDEEALCVVNSNGREDRGARVLVDADLNPPDSAMTVLLNTAQAAGIGGSHQVGETIPVKRTAEGKAYVEIHSLRASEALVLINRT